MTTETMRIGEVAVRAGVHIQTLRFDERRGLLQAPHRQRSGCREYPPEAVQIVQFIRRAQEIGFTPPAGSMDTPDDVTRGAPPAAMI